jgi:hypothetical protein
VILKLAFSYDSWPTDHVTHRTCDSPFTGLTYGTLLAASLN